MAHGRVMVCGVRGCAAKEEQEECDLRVLNSRDRGQELSLCDVFVVQGRGHIVRVSEGGAEDLESLRVGWQSPVAGPNGGLRAGLVVGGGCPWVPPRQRSTLWSCLGGG